MNYLRGFTFVFVSITLSATTFLFLDILGKPLKLNLRLKYHQVGQEEVSDNVKSWRRCQGDVFRRPDNPLLLSVLVGIGLSLLVEATLTVLLFLLVGKFVFGFVLIFHWLFAFCNGFISSRLFLFFHGTDWIFLAISSAVSMPSMLMI